MKKRLIIVAAVIALLSSCPPAEKPADNPTDNHDDPVNPQQGTFIVFDNTKGICAVSVYEDYLRRAEDKIAEIPAGNSSGEIEWTHGATVSFYFSYSINLKGIIGFTLNYVPKEIGKDQTTVRINSGKTTNIIVPRLDETLSSPNELLSSNSYLLIQNNSSYSFKLHRGTSEILPNNSSTSLVNSGERALYTINPGAASPYQLLVGADYKAFPGSIANFEAGRVYSFVYDGNVSLTTAEIKIILENVAGPAYTVTPQVPAVSAVTAGNRELNVSWQPVEGALYYEVWTGLTNNSANAQRHGADVSGTHIMLTGLTNGTTYYIWIKAKNTVGTSGFSPVTSGKPIGTPGVPTLNPDFKQLLVTWTPIAGADQYEVYYGTTSTPTMLATTTNGTSATITGLTNGTTYYVRLRAKNANGISDYGPSANQMPSILPGLYRSEVRIGSQNLADSLTYISANAVSGDDFYIVLGANETSSPRTLDYSGKTVGITLLGYGSERRITLNANGSLFTISSGVTLTLDENITLVGRNTNNESLVYVQIDSGLIMNDKAKISGNTSSYGSGLKVNGGTFTMNGGEISDNTASSSYYGGGGVDVSGNGTFTMNSGKISGNTALSFGGGICVSYGKFTMHGGEISGNNVKSTSSGGGGISIDRYGIAIIHDGIISNNESGGGYGGGGIFVYGGTLTMNGGKINGNTSGRFGGGVYVYSYNATFIMHGGIISGNTAKESGGGVDTSSYIFKKLPTSGGLNSGIIYGSEAVGVDVDGIPLKNTGTSYGSAVYSSSMYRNTTAGQTDHIDSTTGMGLSANGNPPYGQ